MMLVLMSACMRVKCAEGRVRRYTCQPCTVHLSASAGVLIPFDISSLHPFLPSHTTPLAACRVKMELIKPAVDWRKAGVKVNTMGAAVAATK